MSQSQKKKCQICNRPFSVKGKINPYQWCPVCRAVKNDEFKKLIKELKK